MRLFIAINFTQQERDALTAGAELLRRNSSSGTFTKEDNFHITLVFLGEQPEHKLKAIRQAINASAGAAFDLSVGGLGKFRRQGGDIYWIGVEKVPELMALADRLQKNLLTAGFDIEDRPYKPHLTLGRQVVLNGSVKNEDMPSFVTHAHRVSLMLSERTRNGMKYTEIYGKELASEQI